MSRAIPSPSPRHSGLWLRVTSHPIVSGVIASLVAAILIFLSSATWRALQPNLTLTVKENGECGGSYWVPNGAPGSLPLPAHSEDAQYGDDHSWAEKVDGIDVGENEIEVVVQGKDDAEIVLRGLRVVIDSRKPATFDQVFYAENPGCGGLYWPNYYEVEIDASDPVAEPKVSDGMDGNPSPLAPFPLRVDQSDSETLIITSRATKAEVIEWHLEIPWYSKGEDGVEVIDNKGEPFRVVGTEARQGKSAFWPDPLGGRRWVPVEG